ncbi:MAG: ATP-binding cassette domain-containing protein, partial [Chitinivibrionales bacterium]|nr:ATP-binding cassette domain-containing protein [Chitinivibrionales bacterium]
LHIPAKTIFGLVGLNGTGKTTLIRLLLGLLSADSGDCRVGGANPADHTKDFYRTCGVVLEHNGLFANLTLWENLQFFSRARALPLEAARDYFDRFWAHTAIGKDNRKVKYFSRGQKMQCGLCRAFLGWPSIYFFDEPVIALDMEAYDHFCAMVAEARRREATMIISSHQLEAVEELCNLVGILENGAVRLLDTIVQKNPLQQWIIQTGQSCVAQRLLEEVLGCPVLYDHDHYVFCIPPQRRESIAECISRLSSAGCLLYEVRPVVETFRQTLRNHFGGLQ